MTRILGVDPSLTGTGLALLDTDDHLVIPTWTIETKGKADANLLDRWERLSDITGQVHNTALGFGPGGNHHPRELPVDLAVIEAPAFSRNNAGTWDRAGLWWRIVDGLISITTVIQIPPTTRAKYATGKGTAGKDEVLLAVAKRYPHVDVKNNNEADALVLAAIGAHLAGHPIDELPKTHLDALAKVARPAGVAA